MSIDSTLGEGTAVMVRLPVIPIEPVETRGEAPVEDLVAP